MSLQEAQKRAAEIEALAAKCAVDERAKWDEKMDTLSGLNGNRLNIYQDALVKIAERNLEIKDEVIGIALCELRDELAKNFAARKALSK